MTYQEVFDWIDENYPELEYAETGDLGEIYEQIESDWSGRNNLSDVISIYEFISNYEK